MPTFWPLRRLSCVRPNSLLQSLISQSKPEVRPLTRIPRNAKRPDVESENRTDDPEATSRGTAVNGDSRRSLPLISEEYRLPWLEGSHGWLLRRHSGRQ